MESYINGKLTEVKNIQIKKVIAKSQKFSELPIKLLSQRVDENIDNEKIWLDAWYIQDQIYRHFNLNPGIPSTSNDPYWRLWNYRKKIKNNR